MAIARLGAYDVLSATITLPRVGAWVATVEVNAQVELSGALDLKLGAQTLRGTVSRGGLVEGLWRGRLVAGADGLRSEVTPRHYTTPAIRVVLTDVLAAAGEELAASASASVLGAVLDHWTLRRMSAGRAIRALVDRAPADTVWRFLQDGTLWLGEDTWPEVTVEYTELDFNAAENRLELGLTEPFLLPGTAIAGRQIDTAELRIGADSISATAWLL